MSRNIAFVPYDSKITLTHQGLRYGPYCSVTEWLRRRTSARLTILPMKCLCLYSEIGILLHTKLMRYSKFELYSEYEQRYIIMGKGGECHVSILKLGLCSLSLGKLPRHYVTKETLKVFRLNKGVLLEFFGFTKA